MVHLWSDCPLRLFFLLLVLLRDGDLQDVCAYHFFSIFEVDIATPFVLDDLGFDTSLELVCVGAEPSKLGKVLIKRLFFLFDLDMVPVFVGLQSCLVIGPIC